MMNFPMAWSPSIHSYLIHQSPYLQTQSPMALLLLQEQNKQKIQQAMYLQQNLLTQLSQTCSKIPFSPQQAFTLPEKIGQSLYFDQLSPKSYWVQDAQQVNPTYVLESHQQGKFQSPIDNFKDQLKQMLDLFMNLCGEEKEESTIAAYRAQYSSNKALLQVFDALLHKYRSCTKNREDILRFVLRKAIISLRDSVRGKYGLSAKGASLVLCKKYFSSRLQELTEHNIDLNDEDQVLNFLLPYKKNSRNKTANGAFVTEIFASEAFYEDYLHFLEKIDDILETDNKKRSKKLIDFLTVCAQEGSFARIKSYKRLPWLKSWLVSAKDIAHQLLNKTQKFEDRKKLVKNF